VSPVTHAPTRKSLAFKNHSKKISGQLDHLRLPGLLE
jgi:hypothetical protein